jgi:hypothetical protein
MLGRQERLTAVEKERLVLGKKERQQRRGSTAGASSKNGEAANDNLSWAITSLVLSTSTRPGCFFPGGVTVGVVKIDIPLH